MSKGAAVPELAQFFSATQELRRIVGEIVEAKKAGGGGDAALVRQCMLKLADVKKANRDAHEAAEALLTDAEEERLRTDTVSQQLQNLQYQKIHLNKELHMCLNYQGTEIDVVSEEQFEASVPEAERGGPRGSHAYELARLQFEMQKREEQVKAHKTQKLRKALYESKLANQRKFLDSIHSHLDSVTASIEPLKKEFSKTGTGYLAMGKADLTRAELLPSPLYCVYMQAVAFQEAFDDRVSASIGGSVAEAQDYISSQATASAKEREDESAAKKHRRKRKAGADDAHGPAGATWAFPLHVTLAVPPKEGAPKDVPSVELVFSYLPNMRVVVVRHSLSNGMVDQALLQDLVPNDLGIFSPNTANDYLYYNHDTRLPLTFNDKRTSGRAYKWAQTLGGSPHLPRLGAGKDAGASSEAASAHAALSFAQIFDRIQSRASSWAQIKVLLSQLDKVQSKGLPQVPGSDVLKNATAVVESWKDVTKEVVKALQQDEDEDAGAPGDVQMGEQPGEEGEVGEAGGGDRGVVHATEREEKETARAGHRYFRASLKKGAWVLQADVEVQGGYPTTPPAFKIKLMQEGPRKTPANTGPLVDADPSAVSAATAGRQAGDATDNALRQIEKEVNDHAIDEAAQAGCPSAQLLAYQLWMLSHCFCIWVDVESGAGVHAQRDHRGRDRRLPFLFNETLHMLEQRPS